MSPLGIARGQERVNMTQIADCEGKSWRKMWMKKVEAQERLWWVEDMATQNVSEMAEATQIARQSADRKRREHGTKMRRAKGVAGGEEMEWRDCEVGLVGVRTVALGRV